MRRILIAAIAGGFLLLSGIAASAKLDSATADQGQNGQQQNQTQQDKKPAPVTKSEAPATKPATPAPAAKPAAPAPKPAVTATECGEQGDNTGDHQNEDVNCNDQTEQADAGESKTNANATAEKGGNTED